MPSWNDIDAKKVISFVEKVTREGAPNLVPVAERIATFDNDGTLWSEQPAYFQLVAATHAVTMEVLTAREIEALRHIASGRSIPTAPTPPQTAS